jgi:hypothetical protein
MLLERPENGVQRVEVNWLVCAVACAVGLYARSGALGRRRRRTNRWCGVGSFACRISFSLERGFVHVRTLVPIFCLVRGFLSFTPSIFIAGGVLDVILSPQIHRAFIAKREALKEKNENTAAEDSILCP